MTTSRLSLRILPLLLFLGATVFVSCSKEKSFGNWLTRGEGTWNVLNMEERFIEFINATDSLPGPYISSTPLNGTFSFSEAGAISFLVYSEALELDMEGDGSYTLEEDLFQHVERIQSANSGEITTTIQGFKVESKRMIVMMRVEHRNAANRLEIAHDIEMLLQRVN